MSDKVTFDNSGLNVWTEPTEFKVEAERISAYAEATNDPIEAHLKGEVASPVFAIVPVFEAMLEPVIDVVPTNLFGRVVHGEQDFVFHRPIRAGETLYSKAAMIGYEGLPNGTRAVIKLECRDEAGDLVNEQFTTCFLRGADAGPKVGELAPDHRFDVSLRDTTPLAVVDAHVDDDQTFRYSPASGDPMPIHLDEQVALDAGLPGIIAHGLCTMAFASWAVLQSVAEGDVARMRRFAVRFSKMVLPGQDLQTRIYQTGQNADGTTNYAFQTYVGGDVVLTDGLAVIA